MMGLAAGGAGWKVVGLSFLFCMSSGWIGKRAFLMSNAANAALVATPNKKRQSCVPAKNNQLFFSGPQSFTRRRHGSVMFETTTSTMNEENDGADLHKKQNESTSPAHKRTTVRFMSPLLEYGYRPAVEEYENKTMTSKPLLLYLPGFDGTFLSPFLQFPELGTIFDVRCMTVAMEDRSTLDELVDCVIRYLEQESFVPDITKNDIGKSPARLKGAAANKKQQQQQQQQQQRKKQSRPIYLTGESFGGILALCTLLALQSREEPSSSLDIQGLTLINAATCYERSKLALEGPRVAKRQKWAYPAGLVQLLPLFTDEYSAEQLLLILQAKALPSVIDTACREAYLGRVAFSLPFVIPFMTQEALAWRLTAWLATGCARLAAGSGETSEQQQLQQQPLLSLKAIRTLIIAGEKDGTLPSIAEAERLASIIPEAIVHVVEGAGHASTCGSRVDLAALFRHRFKELQQQVAPPPPLSPSRDGSISRPFNFWKLPTRRGGATKVRRTAMKKQARVGKGAYFGMEPRYDKAKIGLSPLRYWNKSYYRKWHP